MKLNIPKPILKGISLHQNAIGILNNCFISLVVGPPASGKTSLLKAMLQDQRFYGGKFDQIIFIGPSPFEQQFDQNSRLSSPDPQVIEQFINDINQANIVDDFNLLMIFDDCVTQMNQKQDFWKKLFLNRRHLIKNGTISHIITTQKFSLTPPFIRACLTQMIVFKSSAYEGQALTKWYLDKSLAQSFLKRLTLLKPHQFMFLNLVTGKIYNQQFVDFQKKDMQTEDKWTYWLLVFHITLTICQIFYRLIAGKQDRGTRKQSRSSSVNQDDASSYRNQKKF